jgi:hypothetical protein
MNFGKKGSWHSSGVTEENLSQGLIEDVMADFHTGWGSPRLLCNGNVNDGPTADESPYPSIEVKIG